MTRPRRDISILVLGGALCASAALLIALGWKLTFYQDTWVILLGRRPWTLDAILQPHNEHLIAFQVIFEKLFFEFFGIADNHAEMLLSVALLIGVAALLFVWLRRRVDEWLALIATVMLLFFGSAWQELLWPFQIGFSAPLLFGLGALLALERDDTRGDVAASALLVLCVGSGSLGLAFLVAVGAEILLHHRRGARRLLVLAAPVLLYAGWYLHWGREAEHHLSLDNVLGSPVYVMEGFANAVGTLSGLDDTGELNWGPPLLVGLLALAAFALWRRRAWPAGLSTVLALALAYWLLAAFNTTPGREAAGPRYVYAGAVFVLMIAAELLRDVRPRTRTLAVTAAVATLTILPNLVQLEAGYEHQREETEIVRADTGAVQIARGTVSPFFNLAREGGAPATMDMILAGPLFEAVDAYGPTGYTAAELETAPAVAQHYADVLLGALLQHETVAGYAPTAPAGLACAELGAGEAAGREVPIQPGVSRVEVSPGEPAAISLRRFATGEFPVAAGTVPGGSTTVVTVLADRSEALWYVHVEAAQSVRVCTSS